MDVVRKSFGEASRIEKDRDQIGVSSVDHSMMNKGTGRSSNGKTAASGAAYRGSSPCLPATASRSLFLSEGFSMVLRTSLLLLPVLAFAQDQAPPDVDRELRARVSGFYQNFVDVSYSPRKAEP